MKGGGVEDTEKAVIAWMLALAVLIAALYFEPRFVTVPWHVMRMADTWVWSQLSFMLPNEWARTVNVVHENFVSSPIGSADYAAFWRVEQMLYPFPSVLYALLMVAMGVRIYRRRPPTMKHDMESLLESETEVWRFSRLFVKHNPSKHLDIRKGVWGVRMKPLQFGKKHKILSKDAGSWVVDERKAAKVFAAQLGEKFGDLHKLKRPERWVLAILLLRCEGKQDESDELAGDIGYHYAGQGFSKKDIDKRVTKILDRLSESKVLVAARKRHAYTATVLVYVLEKAREGGKFSTSFVPWTKLESRRLYYILNDVGRPTASAEASGVRAHYKTEVAVGRAVKDPQVDKAVEAFVKQIERENQSSD